MPGDPPPRHHRDGPDTGGQQISRRAGPAAAPAAYVAHWDGHAWSRTPLPRAGDLRAEVDAAVEQGGGDHHRRLFVVRGFPPEHVAALGALGVDPALAEAHAARRGYRPPAPRRRRRRPGGEDGVAAAQVDYPELVRGYGAAAVVGRVGNALPGSPVPAAGGFVSLLRDPLIRPVSDVEDMAAVFCRASLWAGPLAGVLFLDWPAWEEASSPLQLVARPGAREREAPPPPSGGSGGSDGGSSDIEHDPWRRGDAGSLEDGLLDLLAETDGAGPWPDTLAGAVADLAYERWLDFFEVVTPHQQPIIYDGSSLYWQVARALEQNLDAAGRAARRRGGERGGDGPDWRGLLDRTRRRVELLPTVTPRPGFVRRLSWFPSAAAGSGRDRHRGLHPMESSLSASAGRSGSGAGAGRAASSAASPSSSPSGSSSDENQRSLDRVTYLGGVLLPFSMVSGILSMNGDFEPGGRLFWVFWAVAVPIAVFTLLVIYADSIRKAEVWVEVAAEGMADHEHEGQGAGAPPAKEQEKATPPPPPPPRGGAHPRLRHEITYYSTGDEVVIDIPEGAEPPYDGQAAGRLPFPAAAAVVLPRALAEEGAGLEELPPPPPPPRVVVERRGGGARPREWRRQQLGWYGACRHIVGFAAPPRWAMGPPFQPAVVGLPAPARERGRWRKGGGSGSSGSDGRRRAVEVV